ncbi:MAG: hypothetical protein RIB98_17825 [Acidimicrobiales bacterium]
MDSHPIDPVALVTGLFFGLAGLAILAESQWDDIDVTAFTAAGVMLVGLALLGLVVARFLQGAADPVDDAAHDDPTPPT